MRVVRPARIPAAVVEAERPSDPVEADRFDRGLREWAASHGYALTEVLGARRLWRERERRPRPRRGQVP